MHSASSLNATSDYRSFSKLKLIKSYLRSTIGHERLSELSIISIENARDTKLDLKSISKEFSHKKARKMKFEFNV